MSTHSITIDKYIFTIIGKSINDNNPKYFNYYSSNMISETRNKLRIESESLSDKTKIRFNLYTSVSELFCWRLCFNTRSGSKIEKFDNYIQATIINFRLQKYIWEHFDEFPYIQKNESNISPKYINNFLYDNIKLQKNNIKLQEELDDLNYAARLSENDLIKSEIKELISQTNNKIIENEKLSEKYQTKLDEINPHGIINCDNVDESIIIDTDILKRKRIFDKLNIRDFYKNFDIVDLHNNPIIIPDLIIPKLSDSYQEDTYQEESYQKESNLKTLSVFPVSVAIKNCVTEILNKDMERKGWLLDNKIEYCKYNRKYGNKIKNKSQKDTEPEIIIAQIMDFTPLNI